MKSILAGCILLIALPAFAQDPSATCFPQLETRHGLRVLRPVIALGSIKHQNMEMMTNPRYPTLAEKSAIKAWVTERDQCFAKGERWRIQNMPVKMRSTLDHYYAKNKLLIADLYRAKISFGEFASKRATLSSALNAELNQIWYANQHGHTSSPTSAAAQGRPRAENSTALLEAASRIFNSGQQEPVLTAAQNNCTTERSGAYTYTVCR